MQAVKLKDLKHGDFFTLRPIEYPSDTQVYIRERDSYCRSDKRYYCRKFGDWCYSRGFKGDRVVYTDFTF